MRETKRAKFKNPLSHVQLCKGKKKKAPCYACKRRNRSCESARENGSQPAQRCPLPVPASLSSEAIPAAPSRSPRSSQRPGHSAPAAAPRGAAHPPPCTATWRQREEPHRAARRLQPGAASRRRPPRGGPELAACPPRCLAPPAAAAGSARAVPRAPRLKWTDGKDNTGGPRTPLRSTASRGCAQPNPLVSHHSGHPIPHAEVRAQRRLQLINQSRAAVSGRCRLREGTPHRTAPRRFPPAAACGRRAMA